ncbi:MAG: DUF2461 domain-containing protein [Cytophagales bacterium]|nr:DUF2461 domain-containing protein [Cytophagales bacterium]
MITKAYSSFFAELELNNTRDWFQANKSRYEKDVKAPFLALLKQIIDKIQAFDQEISTDPKAAVFRINRDIRFSKDKTPYSTLMKAGISPGGKRSELPGYYLGISSATIHIGGGMFGIDKDQLKKIRSSITSEHEVLADILNATDFKDRFGELKGEHAKRLAPDCKAMLEKAPFIANKQFYVMTEIPMADYLNSDVLSSVLMEYYNAVYPLNRYLKGLLI